MGEDEDTCKSGGLGGTIGKGRVVTRQLPCTCRFSIFVLLELERRRIKGVDVLPGVVRVGRPNNTHDSIINNYSTDIDCGDSGTRVVSFSLLFSPGVLELCLFWFHF